MGVRIYESHGLFFGSILKNADITESNIPDIGFFYYPLQS